MNYEVSIPLPEPRPTAAPLSKPLSGFAHHSANRKLPMNLLIRAVVIAGFLLQSSFATASLTVVPGLTVKNGCHEDVIIAIHYRGSRGYWTTTSFISIRAGQQISRVVGSDNSVFYYYAESRTGIRWAGDHNYMVDGKMYPMKEKTLHLDKEANRFYLELTCS